MLLRPDSHLVFAPVPSVCSSLYICDAFQQFYMLESAVPGAVRFLSTQLTVCDAAYMSVGPSESNDIVKHAWHSILCNSFVRRLAIATCTMFNYTFLQLKETCAMA